MERTVCEACGELQPADWSPGDLCVACGAAARREVRCAWCAEWIPAVRYCRSCGCEVAAPEQYPVARMLKSAGVDRFSLLQRLRELDPEQAVNLARIYNAQLAVVARRVDELRFCERRLLQSTFSRRLEEWLVPALPLEKEQLSKLAAGPQGPAHNDSQTLAGIAESSPIAVTRTLACVALVRLGHFKGTFRVACEALSSDDSEVALEAGLAFGHWRLRLSPYDLWRSRDAVVWGGAPSGIDRRRLAQVAGSVPPGSRLRPWAAAALALAWFGEYGVVPEPSPAAVSGDAPPDWLREELLAGLTGRDVDLRLSCAMALGEDRLIIPLLQSGEPQQKLVARTFLSKRGSPAVADLLLDASDEVCQQIVNDLASPLPPSLVGPVLKLALRPASPTRERCVGLLLPSLNEEIVGRLVRAAVVEKDWAILRILLGAERLPAAGEVVRAALKAGLSSELSGALYDGARHVDLADTGVLSLIGNGDPEIIGHLVEIAGTKIAREDEAKRRTDAGRFLARIAFSSLPSEIRERAYSHLMYGGAWDLFSPAGIQGLFGGTKPFADAILVPLERPEPGQLLMSFLQTLSERWSVVAEVFTDVHGTLKRFVGAIARLAESEERSGSVEAVQLLTTMAIASPAAALPALAVLLRNQGEKHECRDIPARLQAGYETLAPWLARDRKLAAELAGALAQMLWSIEAKDLLTKLAVTCPAGALPVVVGSLRDHGQEWDCPSVLANLLAGYETLGPWLAREHKLGAELAAVLAQILSNETFPSAQWIPVVALLTKLAQDQTAARQPIAERVGRHLDDSHCRDEDLRTALDALAAALGFRSAATGNSAKGGGSSPPEAELDHLPILPDAPLKTLAEYVAFLKAMGASPDPMAVVAAQGMTQETFVACLSRWGEVLGSNEKLAVRYGQLAQQ